MPQQEGDAELGDSEEEESASPAEESPLEFEERFRRLLHTIGASDVDGGTAFRIGDHQVDAIGAIGDHLLVFDCTIRKGSKATIKRLTTKIEQWRGKYPSLLEGLRIHPLYAKYRHVTVVIAANATVATPDKEYAKDETPQICILTRQNIEYLSEIADDIGPYAKYRLTSMLGLELHRPTTQVPALRIEDQGKALFLFALDAKALAELAFVPQAEAGFKLFYQRLIKKGKIVAISDYVRSTKRPFPNSIILATNRSPRFEPSPTSEQLVATPRVVSGTLSLPSEFGSCWVVDGQHRIYGSALSSRDTDLVVTLVPASDLDKARYFLDINANQTKIDSDLKWDLRARLIPDDPEGRISLACQALDAVDSPVKGRVKIPHLGMGRSRPVKLSGLCDAVLKNRIHELHQYRWDSETFVKDLSTDLSHWLRELDAKVGDDGIKERFLFDNSGLSVLFIIFKRIGKKLEHDRPSIAKLLLYADVFSAWIQQLDPSESGTLAQRCSSEAGRADVADRAVAAMNERLPVEVQLEIGGRASKLSDQIVGFESSLRRILDERFIASIGADWLSRANLGGAGVRAPAAPEDLTLGHIFSILHRDEYWRAVSDGFDRNNLRKDLGLNLLQYVLDYRNALQHGRLDKAQKFDERFVENALVTLRRAFSLPAG